jgi:hypothetical protein
MSDQQQPLSEAPAAAVTGTSTAGSSATTVAASVPVTPSMPTAAPPLRRSPVKTRHHLARVISLRGIVREVKQVKGFNAKVAVVLTRGVGTMACAYLFCLIALASLPAILVEAGAVAKSSVPSFLTRPGLILIVSWIAQTFIQLVLLSVIMVGQSVQSAAADARSESTFRDTETILDRLDLHTEGGIKAIMDRLEAIEAALPH